MKRRITITALALSAFLGALVSCRKQTPSWDVDVLAPLVQSVLTLDQIVPDSLLHHNADNSIDLVYRTGLYALALDTLYRLPDTTIRNPYSSPFAATVAPGGIVIPSTTSELQFDLGNAELTHQEIRSGTLTLEMVSSIKQINVSFEIPNLTDASGNTFKKDVVVPAATPGVPGRFSKAYDLSGYGGPLTGLSGKGANIFIINYSAILSLSNDTTMIVPGDSVVIITKFTGIVPQYIKGYFGDTTLYSDPARENFSLFNHIISGTLDLKDVRVDFDIENSTGVDARFTIEHLAAINTKKGDSIPLSHPVIGTALNITRAVDNGGNVTPSPYRFSINTNNSNIRQFINILPDKLNCKLNVKINPLGNISGRNDFVYYKKLLKADMNMTVPLHLVANDLTMADTLDLKLDPAFDNFNYGRLYLYADNGFPFSAAAQLYLMNEQYQVFDSLITTPSPALILAPPLDMNLMCKGTRETKLIIPLPEEKMKSLRAAKRIYVKMRFNTEGQPGYVKVYSFYGMKVKVVGDFNYTVGRK